VLLTTVLGQLRRRVRTESSDVKFANRLVVGAVHNVVLLQRSMNIM